MEKWLPAPGLEDRYEVSDLGRLRYIGPPHGGIETGRIRKAPARGYFQFVVRINGKATKFYVHRLVCWAFHGPPPTPEHEAAHDDGHPENNRADNLFWKTSAENSADMQRHGTVLEGERAPWSKLSLEQVEAIRADPRSQRKIAADYSVSQFTIHKIKADKTWRAREC